MDKNRVTIPKEAIDELKLSRGDYALIKWSANKNLIEIQPVEIKPKKSTA
jgi:bifunctional DNA-binding transcriptional regulator/antitoxin component of YhaV-PrlF toxin-antitoxin module